MGLAMVNVAASALGRPAGRSRSVLPVLYDTWTTERAVQASLPGRKTRQNCIFFLDAFFFFIFPSFHFFFSPLGK